MRVIGAALAAAALVLGPASASADVADYLGKTVSAVRLEIEGKGTTDPKLLAVVETRSGQPLAMTEVRESVTHLFALGRFEDVAVHASLEGGRVSLRYDLTPIHAVTRVDFEGRLDAPGVDTAELRRAIVDRFGAFPPARRSADAALVVAERLSQRGYLHADVTPRVTLDHTAERATLIFTIDPGERTHIGTATVTGVLEPIRQSVLYELGVVPGSAYEPERLRAKIDAWVSSRRARGYFEAAIAPRVDLTDQDRVANLTLAASPGPRVRVVLTGDPIPASLQAEFVPVEREGSSDEDLLEDSTNRIEEYLRAQGYRDASAPHTRQEANGELRLTFAVKRGRQYRVSRVEVAGNSSVPLGEFAASLHLREGQPFSSATLDADLTAIEQFYRRRGFASARAAADFELPDAPADAPVVDTVVRVTIREGVRTTVGSVGIVGNTSVPEGTLRPLLTVAEGQPLSPAQVAADRDQIQLQYANRGFGNATVDANTTLSADGTQADVVFTVHEGARIFVDHILIVGNVRTRTDIIERELALKPGDPLGIEAVNETQRRLSMLGLFRRTRITELRHGDETTRDLIVTVEEAPVTTVGYGGGIEAGQILQQEEAGGPAQTVIDLAPRAFVEVGRRNLFGKNRSINFFARISPHLNGSGGHLTTNGFTEYRVQGSFKEPRIFDSSADASLTAVIEQQRRASFNFARKSLIAEAGRRVSRAVSVSGSYQIQQTKLFDVREVDLIDRLLIDRLFPQLRLSSVLTSLARDTRDDPIDPSRGTYLSGTGQLAARAIGSEVGFAKGLGNAQAFRILPRTKRLVFANNVRIGLATGFPRDIALLDANGDPVSGPDGQPIVNRVEDLPASERFFAGGDTNRGFALDQLGAPDTIDKNGFPTGGNALFIINSELRVPLHGSVGVVGFLDVGNVFARTSDFDLSELRPSAGFGLRYRSPLGPIRVDIGFKLNRHVVAGQLEDPYAIHISLGQAF